LDRRIAQPDYTSFILRDFRAAVIVWLEVAMDDGMRVPSIRFVEVFRGDER
jgi:hypothetical protein